MRKNRANVKGKGTVYYDKKRKCYRGQVIVGTNLDTGNPIRKSISGTTKAEVWEKLDQIKVEFRNQRPNLELINITCKDWIENYINSYMIHSNRHNTLNGIRLNYDRHIKPNIGEIKLRDLTGSDLQWLYNHLSKKGRVDLKGGLSASTIRRIHNIIHQALEQAVAEDIVIKNVSNQVVLMKQTQKEFKPYSADEIKVFLNLIRNEWLYPMIVILIYTGIRRSELLALTWSDVSFDDRTISINKALTQQATADEPSRYKIMPTKSENSNRIIPMAEPLVAVLSERSKVLKSLKLKGGDHNFNKDNFVCVDQHGTLINGNLFTQRFKAILKKYGLRDIRVHDLRHSFATEQLKSGTSAESVRDLLGHSNIQTTLNIYRHVDLNEKREDMDRFTEHLKLKTGQK